jgi:hypothetical protein
MREIRDTDLVGKTIKNIDAGAVNVLNITFTDDTTIELWAEQAVYTSYGSIPGIFVEETSVRPEVEHNHFGEIFMPDTCPACAAQKSKD